MSIFEGITGVKPSRDATYIQPGEYVCQLIRVKEGKSQKKIPFVAFEFVVLHTLHQEKNDEGRVVSHHAGEEVSQLISAGGKGAEMFLPNLKANVMALVGCKAEDVGEEDCKVMVSEKQPMAGLIVHLNAREISTRENNPFTKIVYRGVLSKEEFEALRDAKDQPIPAPKNARFSNSIPGYSKPV